MEKIIYAIGEAVLLEVCEIEEILYPQAELPKSFTIVTRTKEKFKLELTRI